MKLRPREEPWTDGSSAFGASGSHDPETGPGAPDLTLVAGQGQPSGLFQHPYNSIDLASFWPFASPTFCMDNIALSAKHSGVIEHAHSIHFHPSVVDVLKEVRLAIGIVVAGWIGVTTIRALQSGLAGRSRGREDDAGVK